MIVDIDQNHKTKLIVLKPKIIDNEIKEIINKNKTKLFRRFLKKPKPYEVHVHSITLVYEPLMILSGEYTADFYQKAIHEIKVENNVKELVFQDGMFPASNFSVSEKFSSKLQKNIVPVTLEEHTFVSHEKEIVIDHHGKLREFKYKVNTDSIENYPKRTLKKNTVREFEIKEEAAIKKLIKTIQSHDTFEDVRDLNENIKINQITTIYVPIYEARLIGPKKKVEIFRYDSIKKKSI